MAENVKVIIRCRPMNKKEKDMNYKKIINLDNNTICLINPLDTNAPDKQFTFDNIFDENSTTSDIYNTVCYPLIENVIEGYNGTIFAYGQTGCGKSHTMQGPTINYYNNININNINDNNRGIISRAFDHIFETISIITDIRYLVLISYLEIYNETIRDLLNIDNNKNNNLLLKELPGYGIIVENLTKHPVKNFNECELLLKNGINNRIIGKTDMNEVSSRSHTILTIHIEQIKTNVIDNLNNNNNTDNDNDNSINEITSSTSSSETTILKKGKLNLVDLAGSERQNKTNTNGERFKEATKINLSLSALGNVISALIDNKTRHIPYRDSKLTRLLQDSLGGNTKTLMISCISIINYNYDETLSTLRYANRAKNIKNKPIINEDPKDTMLREYHDEIIKLRNLLNIHNNHNIINNDNKYLNNNLHNEYKIKYDNLLINSNKYENENTQLLKMIENLKNDYEKKLFHLNNNQDLNNNQENNNKNQCDHNNYIVNTINNDQKLIKHINLLKNLTIGGESSNDIKRKEYIYKKKLQSNRQQLNNNNNNNNVELNTITSIGKTESTETILNKNDLIIKLNKKINSYKYEINDLQSEFQRERNDYLETIRRNNKYIKFLKQLIDYALPILRKDGRYWDIDIIKRKSLWDDDLIKWKIPDEYLIRQKLPPAVEENNNERENTSVTAPGRLERSSSLISLGNHEQKQQNIEQQLLTKKLQLSEVDNIANTYFRPRRITELLKKNSNTTDTWRDIALRKQINENNLQLYHGNKFNLNKTWTSTTNNNNNNNNNNINDKKNLLLRQNDNIFNLNNFNKINKYNRIGTTASSSASITTKTPTTSSSTSIILDTNV